MMTMMMRKKQNSLRYESSIINKKQQDLVSSTGKKNTKADLKEEDDVGLGVTQRAKSVKVLIIEKYPDVYKKKGRENIQNCI